MVDIGANIGLFSLSVMTPVRTPISSLVRAIASRISALESKLRSLWRDRPHLQCGCVGQAEDGGWTSYEKSSVFSSFHADPDQDRAAIRAVVRNMLTAEVPMPSASTEEYVTELTVDRLHKTTLTNAD